MSARTLQFNTETFDRLLVKSPLFQGAKAAGYELIDQRTLKLNRVITPAEQNKRSPLLYTIQFEVAPVPCRRSESRIIVEGFAWSDRFSEVRVSLIIEEVALSGEGIFREHSHKCDAMSGTSFAAIDEAFLFGRRQAIADRVVLDKVLTQVLSYLQQSIV